MASSRMLALLGLLAVAGYQNRDKIKQVIANIGQGNAGADAGSIPAVRQPVSGAGGLLGGLLGGGNPADALHGGLTDLISHLTERGQGDTARSWVQTGPNQEISNDGLETALGSDVISELTSKTGLSKDDLLARLKTVLPTAVDQMTPEGRLPTQQEAGGWLQKIAGEFA
jgi:uncharacterized protein YidB (DUF937 family)